MGKKLWKADFASLEVSKLVKHYSSGCIRVPRYQRSYVWSRRTHREFIDSILRRGSVAQVLHGYTIAGDQETLWIADGRQRIESLSKILKLDSEESAVVGNIEARLCVHLELKDHSAGYDVFKLVNQNIRLNEYDLQRGIFTGLEEDRESLERDRFYDQIWTLVAGLVDTHRQALNKTEPTKRVGDLRRDALGLWLRFMGSKDTSLLRARGSTLEARARGVYDEEGSGDLDAFRKQLEEAYQAVNDIFVQRLTRSRQKLVAIDAAFASVTIGAFLLGQVNKKTWIETLKNIADHVARCRAKSPPLLDSNYARLTNSEVFNPANDNRIRTDAGSLTTWTSFEAHFGPKQYSRERGRMPAAPGRELGHIKPFSTNGEGEVVSEPAILNRVNGAKPMAEAEAEAYRARVDQDRGAA